MLRGLARYMEGDYARTLDEKPAIWKRGNARILDYGMGACSANAPVALFIPSLINRYYILDLEEERSLLRHLATHGVYPLVVDWGSPGEYEKDFDVGAYVTEILVPAIDFIHGAMGDRLALAGYCMGGVLALAAAQLRAKKISSLALLATPWDFHCRQFAPYVVDPAWRRTLSEAIAARDFMPAEFVQSLFYLTDPWVFEQKFRKFAALDENSRAAHEFMALEHWVNDGVPLTSRVAHDCLIRWAQENQLAKNEWIIDGKKVNPEKLKKPCFIAIPKNDHIVPQECAKPLASYLTKSKIILPSSGHVGMIVGARARKELWHPLTEWINAQ